MKVNVRNVYHKHSIDWDRFLTEEINVYCGRPTKLMPFNSPLGNPFKMEPDADKDEERHRVIELYRNLLWQDIKNKRDNGVTSDRLAMLLKIVDWLKQDKTVNLYCYCIPKPCHCDAIKSCLEYLQSIS